MLHSTVQNQGDPWSVARSWNIIFKLSLSRSVRIQTRSCHSSGFPTLLGLRGSVGKKMYNHWIRWYHHVCVLWSRVGFPHLRDHTVVWYFSGFVTNDVIFFIPIFFPEGSVGATSFLVKSLQPWNQPNICFPQYQELLTCRANPASWLARASHFCWMFHGRWGKGSISWELRVLADSAVSFKWWWWLEHWRNALFSNWKE